MGADKGKKQKVDEENNIDGDLVFSIEKLQEIQDELEKVINPFYSFDYFILLVFFVTILSIIGVSGALFILFLE